MTNLSCSNLRFLATQTTSKEMDLRSFVKLDKYLAANPKLHLASDSYYLLSLAGKIYFAKKVTGLETQSLLDGHVLIDFKSTQYAKHEMDIAFGPDILSKIQSRADIEGKDWLYFFKFESKTNYDYIILANLWIFMENPLV